MKLSDVMSHSGLAGYAIVALILFVLAFAGIVIYLLRPGRRAEDARMRQLPLDDDAPQSPEDVRS